MILSLKPMHAGCDARQPEPEGERRTSHGLNRRPDPSTCLIQVPSCLGPRGVRMIRPRVYSPGCASCMFCGTHRGTLAKMKLLSNKIRRRNESQNMQLQLTFCLSVAP